MKHQHPSVDGISTKLRGRDLLLEVDLVDEEVVVITGVWSDRRNKYVKCSEKLWEAIDHESYPAEAYAKGAEDAQCWAEMRGDAMREEQWEERREGGRG